MEAKKEELKVAEVVEAEDKKEEEYIEEFSEKELELFRDCLSIDSERELFNNRPKLKKRRPKSEGKSLANSFQKLLNGTFCELEDGSKLTIKDRMAFTCVGYVLANPTPQNVKAMADLSGESIMKSSEGSTTVNIVNFFETVKPDEIEGGD